jgi:multidrug efflux pump subunit AcrA (membrane-fusion protein)
VIAAIPTGTTQTGAKIPMRALVYGESEAWVYLQTAENTFQRTKVDISRPLDDGYFVDNVKPGDKVVTDGAGLLMAREINPSTATEE